MTLTETGSVIVAYLPNATSDDNEIMHAQHVLHVHTEVNSCKCTGEVAITNAIEIDTY